MSEARTVLNKAIGNIKRKYSQEDFNPFDAISFVYGNLLHAGAGSTVLVVGSSERFQKEIVRACYHVMSDLGHLNSDELPPPVSQLGTLDTHTGARIKFVHRVDGNAQHEMELEQEFKEAYAVVLCSPYTTPKMRNIIKATCDLKQMYDVSQNNVAK